MLLVLLLQACVGLLFLLRTSCLRQHILVPLLLLLHLRSIMLLMVLLLRLRSPLLLLLLDVKLLQCLCAALWK